MAKINLLPWRTQLRAEQKQEFFALMGMALLMTLFIIGLVHLVFSHIINEQKSINTRLQFEISVLDKELTDISNLKTEITQLKAKMQIIERLQSDRPLIVKIFDTLPKIIPEGIYLNEMDRNGGSILLMGESESNSRVSTLMKNIEKSEVFTDPELTIIEEDKKTNGDNNVSTLLDQKRNFKLSMKINSEGAENEGIPNGF